MGRTLQRYKKLFENLRQRPLRPLYFLYGPEEFIKKEYVNELTEKVVGKTGRTFNLTIIHGDEFDGDVFKDRVSSFPLFAERRQVLLKKFDALSLGNKDLVLEIVANVPESLVVVVETSVEKLDNARMKNLQKIADKIGVSFRFDHLSDDEVVQRVRGRLRKANLGIEPQALDLLIASVGTHLIDLTNELEKIILTASDSETVTVDGVSAVVGKYRTENFFSFLDDLGKSDAARLIARVNRILDGGEEPVFVMAMMIRRVLLLMHVQAVLKEEGAKARSPKVMASRLTGLASPFLAARLIEQCNYLDGKTLSIFLENLRWADINLKTTGIPAKGLIETSLLASSIRKKLALTPN